MADTKPIVLVLAGRPTPADVRRLCDDWAALDARAPAGADVVCDVGGLTRPGLDAVSALARLRLLAGRSGRRVRVRGAGQELLLLLELVGLAGLAGDGATGTTPKGEAPA
ncbi:STAS domain-containing protein [Streptomyces sp. NBC_00370]|uniref:STAS domain-containing protein n=1 Tax=Streptomyces sp. NBC_00370 TaxID=2975728 RepID=UPI002E274ED1